MKDLETQFQIGDKVRTTAVWNSTREPIHGTVMGFECIAHHKTEHKRTLNPRTGLYESGPWYMLPDYTHTRNIKLDNGKSMHESNFEKEE